jgi:2-oxoisovalerate dehydrogenase E1 component alpha subunit
MNRTISLVHRSRICTVSRLASTTRYTSPGLIKGAEIVNDLSHYHLGTPLADSQTPIPVFQQLNEDSDLDKSADFFPGKSDDEIVRIFDLMVKVNVMDTILQDIQRQGRISFYISNFGEEAAQLGSVSALKFEDEIWTQYRELGCFLYRGLSTQMATDQTMSTKHEPGKGRQMPIHYTMIEGHMQSVTSPLGTKILHAAGAGYAFRLDKADRVGVVYFGEGAASEGDFAVGINFAATLGAQTLFICRNNAYAISTPTKDQYKGDGIAARAIAYGMKTIRVDGNDIVAVHNATVAARKEIIENKAPVLLELMTYRRGHHSTSDDSSKYRPVGELEAWTRKGKEPISRFAELLKKKKLISDSHEEELRVKLRQEVIDSIKASEAKKKAPVDDIFTDVYADMPWHLKEQLTGLKEHLKEYGDNYDLSHYDPPRDSH